MDPEGDIPEVQMSTPPEVGVYLIDQQNNSTVANLVPNSTIPELPTTRSRTEIVENIVDSESLYRQKSEQAATKIQALERGRQVRRLSKPQANNWTSPSMQTEQQQPGYRTEFNAADIPEHFKRQDSERAVTQIQAIARGRQTRKQQRTHPSGAKPLDLMPHQSSPQHPNYIPKEIDGENDEFAMQREESVIKIQALQRGRRVRQENPLKSASTNSSRNEDILSLPQTTDVSHHDSNRGNTPGMTPVSPSAKPCWGARLAGNGTARSVGEESSAWLAGIRPGDQIVGIDGFPFSIEHVRNTVVGVPVAVKVLKPSGQTFDTYLVPKTSAPECYGTAIYYAPEQHKDHCMEDYVGDDQSTSESIITLPEAYNKRSASILSSTRHHNENEKQYRWFSTEPRTKKDIPYPAAVSAQLEQAYAQGQKSETFTLKSNSFTLDFEHMKQINSKGFSRPVVRKMVDASESDDSAAVPAAQGGILHMPGPDQSPTLNPQPAATSAVINRGNSKDSLSSSLAVSGGDTTKLKDCCDDIECCDLDCIDCIEIDDEVKMPCLIGSAVLFLLGFIALMLAISAEPVDVNHVALRRNRYTGSLDDETFESDLHWWDPKWKAMPFPTTKQRRRYENQTLASVSGQSLTVNFTVMSRYDPERLHLLVTTAGADALKKVDYLIIGAVKNAAAKLQFLHWINNRSFISEQLTQAIVDELTKASMPFNVTELFIETPVLPRNFLDQRLTVFHKFIEIDKLNFQGRAQTIRLGTQINVSNTQRETSVLMSEFANEAAKKRAVAEVGRTNTLRAVTGKWMGYLATNLSVSRNELPKLVNFNLLMNRAERIAQARMQDAGIADAAMVQASGGLQGATIDALLELIIDAPKKNTQFLIRSPSNV